MKIETKFNTIIIKFIENETHHRNIIIVSVYNDLMNNIIVDYIPSGYTKTFTRLITVLEFLKFSLNRSFVKSKNRNIIHAKNALEKNNTFDE